jgi:hypothetical protein
VVASETLASWNAQAARSSTTRKNKKDQISYSTKKRGYYGISFNLVANILFKRENVAIKSTIWVTLLAPKDSIAPIQEQTLNARKDKSLTIKWKQTTQSLTT